MSAIRWKLQRVTPVNACVLWDTCLHMLNPVPAEGKVACAPQRHPRDVAFPFGVQCGCLPRKRTKHQLQQGTTFYKRKPHKSTNTFQVFQTTPVPNRTLRRTSITTRQPSTWRTLSTSKALAIKRARRKSVTSSASGTYIALLRVAPVLAAARSTPLTAFHLLTASQRQDPVSVRHAKVRRWLVSAVGYRDVREGDCC